MKWSEIEYFLKHIDFSRSNRVLDVGCGNGRLLEYIGQDQVEYIGMDSSEMMLEEAKKLHPERIFFLLDMTRIDRIVLKEFDTIFFIASFHHLENASTRKTVLEKTKQLLKPG
jgi:2-polyprenyl-3-methyl-5-hydroxy-6-metoxy-1,4-benzoquinol methylase